MYKEGVFTKLAADCTRMARKEDSSKKLAQGINSPNSRIQCKTIGVQCSTVQKRKSFKDYSPKNDRKFLTREPLYS